MWEWENWIDWIGSPDFFFLICNFSQETSFCLVLHWPFKVNLNSNVWFLKANNCTRLLVRPTKHKQTFMKQLWTLRKRRWKVLTKVTSKNSSSSLISEKAEVMLVWKSFHRKQNCSVDILSGMHHTAATPSIWNKTFK